MSAKQISLLDPSILKTAAVESFKKLAPQHVAKNPVMFVVEIGSVLTTVMCFVHFSGINVALTAWLWFTVVFANFAEAIAEGRGKAQADTLRKMRKDTTAVRRKAEGIASVDESAITGESAPVIRESGGDRSAVTGGTKVLSDRIVVRIGANPG